MKYQALIVGINYRGTSSALRGCINDAINMSNLLVERGFPRENILLLTDATEVKPTKANIVRELTNLVQSGADNLFFHYSGHGTSVPDRNGDEKDHRDEALCPLDYQRAGFITDDQIRSILVKAPKDARITCILDCCHSGTGCDLAYQLGKAKGQFRLIRDGHYADTNAAIVMLSGCRDAQTSADAYIGGTFQGALTAAVIFAVQHARVANWEALYTIVRKHLKQCRYRQVPNMTFGRRIGTKNPLFF